MPAPAHCPACDRPAAVVGGLCSNCGILRGEPPAAIKPRQRIVRGSSFSDNLEIVFLLAPGSALFVLGLLWLGETAAAIGGVLVVLALLARGALNWL